MTSVHIAAIITTILAIILTNIFIFKKSKNKKLLITLCFLQIPSSYLMFHFVRLPFDAWLRTGIMNSSSLYTFITGFYGPVTEELAKLWPIFFIPLIYRKLDKKNAVEMGLALGAGFAIGEIWMIALLLAKKPEIIAYPWYMFAGFISERILVMPLHGGFTAIALYFLNKKKVILGIFLAITLHYFLNAPIFFIDWNLFGIGKGVWAILYSIWFGFYIFGIFTILKYCSEGKVNLGKKLFGEINCPECGQKYPRPFLGINLGLKRYEKCPHCKKWHFTK